MIRALSIIVALALFGVAAWLFTKHEPNVTPPLIVERSMAFNSVLPPVELSTALSAARESILDAADKVRRYRSIADILLLTVTILGGITALGAALRGLGVRSEVGAILLVVVGAASGGSSASAAWLNEQADETVQCIEKVEDASQTALAQVRDETDIEKARAHLTELEAARRSCFS